jgi:hypothetical protein
LADNAEQGNEAAKHLFNILQLLRDLLLLLCQLLLQLLTPLQCCLQLLLQVLIALQKPQPVTRVTMQHTDTAVLIA